MDPSHCQIRVIVASATLMDPTHRWIRLTVAFESPLTVCRHFPWQQRFNSFNAHWAIGKERRLRTAAHMNHSDHCAWARAERGSRPLGHRLGAMAQDCRTHEPLQPWRLGPGGARVAVTGLSARSNGSGLPHTTARDCQLVCSTGAVLPGTEHFLLWWHHFLRVDPAFRGSGRTGTKVAAVQEAGRPSF